MRYQIRRPAAVFAIAILATITAFCPMLLCTQPASSTGGHSCCPKSSHKPGPLPCDATSHACPYTLLEKAKSVPVPLAVVPPAISAIAAPVLRREFVRTVPAAIPVAEDLYLRNRVLLI